MATWQAGQTIAEAGVTLRQRIGGEEPWGVIWRGTHATHGPVIAVFYRGDVGRALFDEARAGLARWQELAAAKLVAGLLPILELNEDAPYLLVPDGGGRTIRERFVGGWPSLREPADALVAIAKILVYTKTYELPAVGITPDNVIESGPHGDAPWSLIPVAPSATRQAAQVSAGRYAAPEVVAGGNIAELNADSYGLSWLALDIYRKDFSAPRDPARIREQLPYQRLRTILGNGLRLNKGIYDDPKFFQLALERWIKNEMAEDSKEEDERQAAQVRKPWQQKLHDNRTIITRAGIALGSVILLLLMVMCVPKLFVAGATEKTPHGLVKLYYKALVANDPATAKKYTTNMAGPMTDQLLAEIHSMEAKSQCSKFAQAVPGIQGDGAARNVKTDLKGKNGDLFMMTEMTIRQQPGGEWRIDELYFKSLVDEAQK